jgi:hypothetical protein
MNRPRLVRTGQDSQPRKLADLASFTIRRVPEFDRVTWTRKSSSPELTRKTVEGAAGPVKFGEALFLVAKLF